MGYNIAIDGPAGAGKSTIARKVAKQLGLVYVDTGAMYRAITVFLIREKVDLSNEKEVADQCSKADITIRYHKGEQAVFLNGENVNGLLRTEEVSRLTSVVSAQQAVRDKLRALQIRLAAESDCIMDGRDIGTCVLPNADVKIFLTASSAVRAKRRYEELSAKGIDCDLNQIQKDIEERDYRDTHREIAPLVQAPDAVLVDTSEMTIEEVTDCIVSLCGEYAGNNHS